MRIRSQLITVVSDKVVTHKKLLTDGISLVTMAAALVTFLFPALHEGPIKFFLFAVFLTGCVLFIALRRVEHLSPPEARSIYQINIPCSPAELDDAIEIAQHFFGKDSMSPDVVRKAYQVNPFSFIVIKDMTGKVVGYFDHFGLRNDVFDQFLAGETTEGLLDESSFDSGEEIVTARRIYVGGIAIRCSSKYEAGKITKCLLFAASELLQKRYLQGETEFSLYATGFSREGREMLKALGFGKVAEASERSDQAPLYWRSVSRKGVARYRSENPICKSELILKIDREPRAYQQVIRPTQRRPGRLSVKAAKR